MDAFLMKVYEVVLQPIIFLVFGLAFLLFMWGIVKFLKDKDNETKREEGKKSIMYGILGMLIMVSVFGIINIIAGTMGVDVPVDDAKLRQDIDSIDVKTDL